MVLSTPYSYRGVVLVGLPGSGKTSTAVALEKSLQACAMLEASTDIILPLLNSSCLPTGLHQIASSIARSPSQERPAPLLSHEEFRVSARYLFVNLARAYGESWVARLIEILHELLFPGKLLIISGVRGSENARRLQEAGYLVVFLSGSSDIFARRRSMRDQIKMAAARQEQEREEAIYRTGSLADFATVVDSSAFSLDKVCQRIMSRLGCIECESCINSSNNPAITFNDGRCSVCQRFEKFFCPATLTSELDFVRSFKGSRSTVMVGMSGGKDSSAAAFLAKDLGLDPMGFTFDIGYYPEHIFSRAIEVAGVLGMRHEVIRIGKYISQGSLESYRLTADLYDLEESVAASSAFRQKYSEARGLYSVKEQKPMAYVRSCQLCRKTVIPAYYGEALARGARLVILGINEWTGLSQSAADGAYVFSGVRRLKPFHNKPSVYIAHLPFILRMTRGKTEDVLGQVGWSPPAGEDLVESNANSCLLARAAEEKAKRMLGFHPDSTRLAREVTVGFLDKSEARRAIEKRHDFDMSVRDVLRAANLLN